MAHKDVEVAVEARLRAHWDRCEIRLENEDAQTPADGSAFLTLQFPFSEVRRWPVNARYYREEGGFRLVLSMPTGTGTETIRDWGEDLRSLFIDSAFDGVVCQVPSSPMLDSQQGEGPYTLAMIVVPFTFNFTVA